MLNYLSRKPEEDELTISDDEIILRRFSNKWEDFFSSMGTNDFKAGISCDRLELLEDSTHALFNKIEVDDECQYNDVSDRNTLIQTSKTLLSTKMHKDTRVAYVEYSFLPCNVAHCDVKFTPDIANLPKTEIRDLKFLSQRFSTLINGQNNQLSLTQLQLNNHTPTYWAASAGFVAGRDALGIQNSSVALYSILLPGITNVSERIRYFGFNCWLLKQYHDLDIDKESKEHQYNFIRRGELVISFLMQHLHPDYGSVPGKLFAADFKSKFRSRLEKFIATDFKVIRQILLDNKTSIESFRR